MFHVCVAMNCGLLDQGCLVCTLSGRVQRICLRALLENMSCGFGQASALAGLLPNASATALEVPEPARSRDAWIRNQSLALSHDSRGPNAWCKWYLCVYVCDRERENVCVCVWVFYLKFHRACFFGCRCRTCRKNEKQTHIFAFWHIFVLFYVAHCLVLLCTFHAAHHISLGLTCCTF